MAVIFQRSQWGEKRQSKVRIFARPHTLPAKFSIAHQFARIAVLQSGADALRQAQRNALEGHNGFILPRRGLRIDVAPAIPFLRFLLRQLEGALRRGKGDNRLMLPAVPLLCSSARRTPMREKRTLPNRGSKASGNSHSSLSRCHSVWPASHSRPTALAAAVTAAASRSFSGVNGNLPTL